MVARGRADRQSMHSSGLDASLNGVRLLLKRGTKCKDAKNSALWTVLLELLKNYLKNQEITLQTPRV